MASSKLIPRISNRHLNMKDQDEWILRKGQVYPGATIAITMIDTHGDRIGNFYLNDISLKALEKLQAMLGPYIEEERAKVQATKEAVAEANRIWEETGVPPWRQKE